MTMTHINTGHRAPLVHRFIFCSNHVHRSPCVSHRRYSRARCAGATARQPLVQVLHLPALTASSRTNLAVPQQFVQPCRDIRYLVCEWECHADTVGEYRRGGAGGRGRGICDVQVLPRRPGLVDTD
jgi:hypothetical protein